jgi:hypothetical protein
MNYTSLSVLAALLMLAVLSPAHAQSFGRTTIGTAPSDGLRADFKRGSKFTLAESGTVTQLCGYLDGQGGVSGTQSIRFVLYRDSSGVPGAKVGEAPVRTISSGAAAKWICADTALWPVTPGAYWIMLQSGGTANVARFYSDGVANWYGNADTFADGASDPFGAGGTGNGTLSLYAAYQTSDTLRNYGRTTVGANPSSGMRADYKRASRIELPDYGRGRAFSVYMDGLGGGTGSQDVRLTLYFGNQVPEDQFLYYTATVTIPAGMKPQWVTVPVPPVDFEYMPGFDPQGPYWLTIQSGSNAGVARYYSDGTGNWCGHADTYSDGLDNLFGTCEAGNGTISAFFTLDIGDFSGTERVGNNNVATATPSSGMSANFIRGSKFTVTGDSAALDSVNVYLDGLGGAAGSQQMRVVVYDDSPGHKLIGASNPVTINAGDQPGWRTFDYHYPIFPLRLPPGDYYFMLFTGGTAGVARNYGTPTPNWLGIGANFASGAPTILDPPPADAATGTVTLSMYTDLSVRSED